MLITFLIFLSFNHEDGIDDSMGRQGPEGIRDPKGYPGKIAELEAITAFGKCEVTSGQFILDHWKFVYINKDNSIAIFKKDVIGFKSNWTTNILVSEDLVTPVP